MRRELESRWRYAEPDPRAGQRVAIHYAGGEMMRCDRRPLTFAGPRQRRQHFQIMQGNA